MDLFELDTPCLILDRRICARNAARGQAQARAAGVRLRPHLKVTKCAEVAALARAEGAETFAVATLREARFLFERGVDDLMLAIGLPPQRVNDVAALNAQGHRLSIVTDSLDTVGEIAKAGRRGAQFDVLIEVDTGGRRAGIDPEDPDFVEIARRLDRSEGVELAGLMTYAGQVYKAATREEMAEIARHERLGAAAAAGRLADAGLPCPIVSVGSTQVLANADELTHVTEVRAGTYLVNDARTAALGTCTTDDVAMSVLATVIGHSRAAGHLVVDAGALALPAAAGANVDLPHPCHGIVYDESGTRRVRDLHVAGVSQEHGIVRSSDPIDWDAFPVGSRFRIHPVAANLAAAAFDRFRVVDGTSQVVDEWQRATGW